VPAHQASEPGGCCSVNVGLSFIGLGICLLVGFLPVASFPRARAINCTAYAGKVILIQPMLKGGRSSS
jgi:hypothetical protein